MLLGTPRGERLVERVPDMFTDPTAEIGAWESALEDRGWPERRRHVSFT